LPRLNWSPEALADVRQVRSVTGCRSLQTIQMLADPWMTWTQNIRKASISFLTRLCRPDQMYQIPSSMAGATWATFSVLSEK